MWFTLALIVAGLVAFGFPKGEEPTFCTQEAMQCPDGSYVGRTGPKCEFMACPTLPAVPQGYSLENYTVEKVTGEACTRASECETPGEYLIQSRCPFTSLCLENRCAVVCPVFESGAK